MDDGWAPGPHPDTHEAARPSSPASNRAKEVRLVATGAAIALLLWFAFANLQRVSIRFWVTSASAPLIVVIVISASLGAAASGLWSWAARRRRRDAPHP